MLTYKYRMYPNKNQQKILWSHSKVLNWLYNFFLNLKINTYQDHKQHLSKADLDRILTDLKYDNPSWCSIYSQVLQQASRRLDRTFQSFFNSCFGFPHFRSGARFFGICYPQNGYKIQDNKLITKAYGKLRFIKHREFEGKIKQIYMTFDKHWYLCITTDAVKTKIDSNSNSIGLDLGITKFATLSDGRSTPKLKDIEYFDKKINNLKSKRDLKCKKRSRRHRYLSSCIRKLYVAKNRKINHFLHEVSAYLSQTYDVVCIENLNVKKMSESKAKGLNREIRNVAWSRFITQLEYKCKELIKVPAYNTSKKCSSCGKIHQLTLKDRTISCDCGLTLDRDVNAAINIHCQGLAMRKHALLTAIAV